MADLSKFGKIGIWIGIGAVSYVGLVGAMGGTTSDSLGRAQLQVALTAIPLLLAAHIWRTEGVILVAVGLSFPAAMGIMASSPGSPLWPTALALVAIDLVAVRYSMLVQEAKNRSVDLDIVGQIVQSLANGAELTAIADRLNVGSQHFMGTSRVRLWVVNPRQNEIRLVPTGDEAVAARQPGQNKYGGTRLNYPLDSTLASAVAASKGEAVDVADLLQSGPELLLSHQQAEFDGHRSVLALPLFSRGEVTGVLSLETAQKGARRFTKSERLKLGTLAALGTIALDEASAHQGLPL